MKPQRREEELLSQEIEKLDKEIEKLTKQNTKVQEEIKRLVSQEDIGKGIIYAKEINDLKLEKLRLQVEIDICEKKKKRLLLGI